MKTSNIIEWKETKEEAKIIGKIAARARPIYARVGESQATAYMDIANCHGNACKLALAELLAASDMDFSHDIAGIRRFIDRQQGGWEKDAIFEPRYALANHQPKGPSYKVSFSKDGSLGKAQECDPVNNLSQAQAMAAVKVREGNKSVTILKRAEDGVNNDKYFLDLIVK